ncbi:TetR/AcrR family transcriptional regulator [Streptomyces phaeochromogenes]|uniref:TetR/AcrR family transcriptional regulator n=1 Tax=Streptomyces phaeochromogenes TaxID=1923 RepID=UPI0033ED2687
MPYDSAATRARILAAAIEEFSAYGLAGARVDRIAEAADANKRSIYVYYTNKELLFSATLHEVISRVNEAVPLTEDDLPGYAARMFDHLIAHPAALRMHLWRQLERPELGPDAADVYSQKMAGMKAASTVGQLPPTDLLVFITGLAQSWILTPRDLLTAADGGDPFAAERLAAHRAAIVEAARRLCEPAPQASATTP